MSLCRYILKLNAKNLSQPSCPIVGGFDGSSYLKSVEWFDRKTNQWKLAGSMSYRRLGCGVGVVWTTWVYPYTCAVQINSFKSTHSWHLQYLHVTCITYYDKTNREFTLTCPWLFAANSTLVQPLQHTALTNPVGSGGWPASPDPLLGWSRLS